VSDFSWGEAQILYVLDASAYSFKLTAIRRQRSYVRDQKAGTLDSGITQAQAATWWVRWTDPSIPSRV
jgi:hypothetical protein